MADKEEIKTLEELEEKGRILREYKEKFRQMCQENKMIKGSTVLKLYDKIETDGRQYIKTVYGCLLYTSRCV